MTIQRALIAIAAISALTDVPAWAADLAISAPAPPQATPVTPLVPNWTGFYAGIDGGWGGAYNDDQIAGLGSASFGIPFSTGGGMPGTVANIKTSGAIAGGHIGYNYQFSRWVVGLEISADWTGIEGSTIS